MEPERNTHSWAAKGIAVGAIVMVVVVCGAAMSRFSLSPAGLADRLAACGWWGLLVFAAAFVVAGAVCTPPALFAVAAGLVWPLPVALGVSMVAGLGASVLGFLVSRYVARDVCSRAIPERLSGYNDMLARHGLKTTILLRLLFFLFPPVNWLLGVSRIRLRDFVVGTIIGAVPGLLLYTHLGDGLLPWILDDPVPRLAAGGAALLGLCLLGVLVRRLLRARHGPADQGPSLSPRLFAASFLTYLELAVRSLWPPRPYRGVPSLRRLVVMLVFIPLLGTVLAIHWLALCLDEILFPAYRSVSVTAPVFVVGIPRSGTTFLHRVLARDAAQFSVLRLWEVLFAPAVCERRLIRLGARIDGAVGRPLGRLLTWVTARITGDLADIHKLSLQQPEEDFVLLLPVFACFVLIAAFPWARSLDDVGHFDARLPDSHRRDVMAFYRGLLQRHLYCTPGDRTLLSKNVSFTPMLASLRETFPDGRFVLCVRDPLQAVPSQISAMEGGWRAFGNATDTPLFRDRWTELIEHYCDCIIDGLQHPGSQAVECVEMRRLQQNVDGTVRRLYDAFGLDISDDFAACLEQDTARSRAYRSKHSYSLDAYGLDAGALRQRFSQRWSALRQQFEHDH